MNNRQHHTFEDKPTFIFCSYAPEDEKYYGKLENQFTLMKTRKLITTWSTKEILGGQNRRYEIQKAFHKADLVLLLISPDFLASEELYKQAQQALERHKRGETQIIPIMLRPVSGWESSEFGEITTLPKEEKAISAWGKNSDAAFASVAESIQEIVEKLRRIEKMLEGEEHSRQQGQAQDRKYFEQGYALIIGINEYQHIPELSEVILKDALKLHDVVRDANLCAYRHGNVRLLLNGKATVDGIRNGLNWLAQAAGEGATALIYFSGHGLKVPQDGKERFYLLSHESNFADLPNTTFTEDEFTRLQENIRAQRLLICLDCCHAEGMTEIKGPDPAFPQDARPPDEHDYARLAQGTGRVILGAALKNEEADAIPALNNSLFTHYLLEALQGKAHSREDGLIRVMDVFDYISGVISSQSQHAIFKGSAQDNFPIALYRGGAQMKMNEQQHKPKGVTVSDRQLREAMNQIFSDSNQLELFCADIESDLQEDNIQLPVNLATISGNVPLPNQIFKLVNYMRGNGHLDYLVRAVRQKRPDLI